MLVESSIKLFGQYVSSLNFLSISANLELQSMGGGLLRIKGIHTGLYVAMNNEGDLYSTVSSNFQLVKERETILHVTI